MPDLAALGISIDARDAVRGRQELDRLTESAGGAERATDRLQRASRAAGAGLGLVVTGATGAVITLDRLIKRAAGFQDFADKTGAAAAGIASLQTAADVAETPISEIAQAANRLTVNLSKVDDEGDGAARALSALGLSVEEIRRQSPDEQMRAIAQALAGFTDGAAKAAVATALYGRGGAELLPVLKELGQETQRVTYLTNEQIAAADDYADGQARLQSQLQQLAQAAALQAAPALTALLTATRDAAEESLGLSRATDVLSANRGVESFATSAVKSFAFVVDAGDGVVRMFQTVGSAIGATAAAASLAAQGEFRAARQALTEGADDIDRILQRSLFSDRVQKALDDMRNTGAQAERATRSLNFVAPERAPRQQRATRAPSGAAAFVGPEVPQPLLDALRTIQGTEVTKIAELRDELQALLSIQAAGTGNGPAVDEAIKRVQAEIASLEPATQAAALRQQQLNALLADTPSARLAQARAEMQLLSDALERGEITADQFNEAVTARLHLVPEQAREANDAIKELGLTFSSALEDALVNFKDARSVLAGLGEDLTRLTTRKLIIEPITTEITKSLQNLSGGGGLSGMFQSLLGGGGAASQSAAATSAAAATTAATTATTAQTAAVTAATASISAQTAAVGAQTAAVTSATASLGAQTAAYTAETAAVTTATAALTASTAAYTADAAATSAGSAATLAAASANSALAASAAAAAAALATVAATAPAAGAGGGTGSLIASAFSAIFAAKGKAFGPSGIQAYAKGDVFSSPTLFQFAKGGGFNLGVMGEAGPEAVMPLERGPGGSLGVRMYGGPGQQSAPAPAPVVNVKIENAPQGSQVTSRQNESGGTDILVRFMDAVAQDISNGGKVGRAVANRFGANGASTLKR